MYRQGGSFMCKTCNMLVTADSPKLCCRNAYLSASHFTTNSIYSTRNQPVLNYSTSPYTYSPKYDPTSPYTYSPKYDPTSPYTYSPKYNPTSPKDEIMEVD